MVDLFNRIDAASRVDLQLLNEQSAGRFEARIEQRSAELRVEIHQLSTRIDGLGARIGALEVTVARMDRQLAEFPASLERALHAHTRWMMGAWGIVLASQVALWLR